MNKDFVYINPHFKKGKSKTIFTVCAVSGFDRNELGLKRTYGWYTKLKDAYKDVIANRGDLWESSYDYIVIEEVKEGVWGMAIKEWWFKWNWQDSKKGFHPIRKPKETKGTINWSIG